ncbi:MAG: sensor histidine kinase [Candidatus Aquicultor sp.]
MGNTGNYWRPSGVWGTDLRNNLFLKARLRLTFFYVVVIAVVLAAFSIALYYGFTQNIQDEIDGNFANEKSQEAFISNTVSKLQDEILLIDGCIILFVGGLGFWLAGKTLKPIQETLNSQKRFVADASHELRTPLAIMKTNLEVTLKDKVQASECPQALASNLEEVERMNRIVEDLLILSRIDSSQERLQFSKTDLSELIVQTVEKMQVYAGNKNVIIRTDIERPLYVLGDHHKLKQVFFNILKNAIDYSNNLGEVKINARKVANQAAIVIEDNGIGISPEDLPHVFERFYRADKSRSRKQGGSGLGLSIVKWIIQEHRGNISLQSLPDQGTTISISLPLFPSS